MRYLFLIRVAEDASPSPEQADPEAWVEETTRRGQRLLGERLRSDSDASYVRVVEGERVVVDGPFAEAREQVAGFGVIEAEDLDEAIAVMSRHPVAALGPIEIRPFVADAELDAEVLRSL